MLLATRREKRSDDDAREGQLHFGHDVLRPFHVYENERECLADILQFGRSPHSELQFLFNLSLTAGVESWEALIDYARSLHARGTDPTSLDGNDLLTFVWYIFQRHSTAPQEEWHETDQLITFARQLEHKSSAILPSSGSPSPSTQPSTKPPASSRAPKRKRQGATSHYWAQEPQIGDRGDRQDVPSHSYQEPSSTTLRLVQQAPALATRQETNSGDKKFEEPLTSEQPFGPIKPLGQTGNKIPGGGGNATSPYFASSLEPQSPSPKRPPPGIVSCVPFPPLNSESFGLIQEKVANEPFWLLVAITFLIRTKGTAALPVFYAVKEKFSSPTAIADPGNGDEILGMIKHLGLSANRLRSLQKYARVFIDNPPQAGKVYHVRNYDRRETVPGLDDATSSNTRRPSAGMLTPREEDEDGEAWEIGHMTQGKYAVDSWRIFCRDVLLGRAEDWNGEGCKPEFQPEWMRVRPDDKELRAYLRWMWMREGWEWDPETGELAVLRGELHQAVDERRVEYDDFGGLRILQEPRPKAPEDIRGA